MQLITIEGQEYEVTPLTPAKGRRYRKKIDELAVRLVNPWKECFEQVKDLPERLQEIAFQKLPNSIFPLSPELWRRVSLEPEAVAELFFLATGEVGVVTIHNVLVVHDLLWDAIGASLSAQWDGEDKPVPPGPEMESILAPLLAAAEKRKEATDDTEEESTGMDCANELDEAEGLPHDWS